MHRTIFRDEPPTGTAFTAVAQHLSFVLGHHFCVGALLAKTEVEVGTDQLLDTMPDLELDAEVSPAERGLFTRGPAKLPVRLRVPRTRG